MNLIDKVYILQEFLPLCICRKLRLYLETNSARALKAYYPEAHYIMSKELLEYLGKKANKWWCWKRARALLLWPICLREHQWYYPGWINEGQICRDCSKKKKDTTPINELCKPRCRQVRCRMLY